MKGLVVLSLVLMLTVPAVYPIWIPGTYTRPRVLTLSPADLPRQAGVIGYYTISQLEEWDPSHINIYKTGHSSGVTVAPAGAYVQYHEAMPLGPYIIRHVVAIDIETEEGDSGGPAYTLELTYVRGRPVYRVVLIGILMASLHYAWFVYVHGIELETGVKPLLYP